MRLKPLLAVLVACSERLFMPVSQALTRPSPHGQTGHPPMQLQSLHHSCPHQPPAGSHQPAPAVAAALPVSEEAGTANLGESSATLQPDLQPPAQQTAAAIPADSLEAFASPPAVPAQPPSPRMVRDEICNVLSSIAHVAERVEVATQHLQNELGPCLSQDTAEEMWRTLQHCVHQMT